MRYTWLSHHSTELGEALRRGKGPPGGVRRGESGVRGERPERLAIIEWCGRLRRDCALSYGPRMGADDVVVVQQNEMENETVVFQARARGASVDGAFFY